MKYLSSILAISILFLLFTGCGCTHDWQEASCQVPRTCTLCGQTEGEPLGHSWADASCETPKTCTRCSQTDGTPLGHSWADASCEAPKTCTRCSQTDGEPLGHSRGAWTCNGETFQYSCVVCGQEQCLAPEAFYLELLAGSWKANRVSLSSSDLDESVTFHKDGTVDMKLNSNLVCPDTLRMVAGELVFSKAISSWAISYYLEDYLTEAPNRLDEDHGLYLLVTLRENRQDNGMVIMLQHRGYNYTWTLSRE